MDKRPKSKINDCYTNRGNSWLKKFLCEYPGKYLIEVERNYLLEDFNWYGIEHEYRKKYKNILTGRDSFVSGTHKEEELIGTYFKIHGRYMTSSNFDAKLIREKSENKIYGVCPNFKCCNSPLLPYGFTSDENPNDKRILLYCKSCCDVYTPPKSLECFEQIDPVAFPPAYLVMMLNDKRKDKRIFNKEKVVNDKMEPVKIKLFGFELDDSTSSASV